MRRIHALSSGIPRRINLLCDRALLGAYAEGKTSVGRAVVEKAAREVFDRKVGVPSSRRARPLAVAGGLGLAGGAALFAVATVALDRSSNATAPAIASTQSVANAAASVPASGAAGLAASAVVPAVVSLAEFKAAHASASRSEQDAWRELAAAWPLALGDDEPCKAAQRQQVQCFRSPATTLALVRQLDRPGIVTLQGDGEPVHAVLTGLAGGNATLSIGGAKSTISLATLGKLWRGDFATFWRVPASYDNRIIDAASPAAGWLVSQLAKVDGEPVESPTDGALKARVAAFQLAQGLKADGLAGPTTLMQLNRATRVDEPRLLSER
jgi:general secretion pathway protein A